MASRTLIHPSLWRGESQPNRLASDSSLIKRKPISQRSRTMWMRFYGRLPVAFQTGRLKTFISDPIFYLVAIPAILLSGISKGGFGSAVGGLGVPLMALAISPPQAAAILLPVLCLMDVVGFRVYYQKWDIPNLKIMIPGGLVGIIVGTLTFGSL